MLTPEQLRFFVREGYVICEGLIRPELVRSWREQVWASLDVDRQDQRALWDTTAGKRCTGAYTTEARRRLTYPWPADNRPVDPCPFSPSVIEVAEVRAIVDQLIGAGQYGDGQQSGGAEPADTLVFNWPHPPEKRQPWAPPERAHIEMYRGARPNKVHLPAGWCHQFQLGAISYLEDVFPQGGGTHLLPRSHEAIHRYFCSRPDDVRTGGHVGTIIDAVRDNTSATLSSTRLDAVCPGGFRAPPPLELCMKAGSVCFWHHWMCHDSSYNASNNPRQAIFSRWHNVREDLLTTEEVVLANPLLDGPDLGTKRRIRACWDIGGVRTDGDLWKWWGPEVREAAAAAAETDQFAAARM